MGFAEKFKRALGFSLVSDSEEVDEADLLDTSLPVYAAERPASAQPPANPQIGAADSRVTDNSLPGDLFDAVIGMFNATMPEFVTRSLSLESQRRYIYDSLAEGLRRRIEAVAANATAASDTSSPQAGAQPAEELKEKMEQMRLSNERQKRALTDRVLDLQSKVEDLEAENEKLKLDKVVSHRSEGDTAAEAELTGLRQEIARLTEINENLQTKVTMADAMINDLTAKASASQKEVEQLNADLKVVEEISSQLDEVEKIVERKDARIAELTAELEQTEGKLKMVQEERESMRRTIETNLYNQAHNENRLRKEIKQLEKKLATNQCSDSDTASKPKRTRRKISAIDEANSSTDWFDSTPPPGEGKPEPTENPDFGYQAPQRKKHTDNDAQMLLW